MGSSVFWEDIESRVRGGARKVPEFATAGIKGVAYFGPALEEFSRH